MRTSFLLLAPLAFLAGCNPNPEPAATESGEAVPPVVAPPAASATPATSAAPNAQAVRIALDGEGLRLVDPQSGASRLLAFGSAGEGVETAVTRSLGAPSGRNRNAECPAGATDFVAYGPLTLDFNRGRFVAWTLTERPGVARTSLAAMDGITLGTTRAEAEESRVVTLLEDSTLDGEFAFRDGRTSGTGGGFFSGTGPRARITGLFAGANCFFR